MVKVFAIIAIAVSLFILSCESKGGGSNKGGDDDVVIGKAFYGYEFVCAIEQGNVFAIQPHPEKSHNIGLQILKNFAEL
jgi:hypothetical protein